MQIAVHLVLRDEETIVGAGLGLGWGRAGVNEGPRPLCMFLRDEAQSRLAPVTNTSSAAAPRIVM
jgi:hypothetical protein